MKENLATPKSALSLFLSFLLLSASVCFAETSAKDMIKQGDDLLRGDTSSGSYKMTVTTANWTRVLELDAISKDRNKSFIRIKSPVKEAGITTLRIDSNMWNYLPKVERTIKIPPSMMLQSWMGSDFTNDDLVKESSVVNDYTHEIINEETINNEPAYKIKLTPKPEAAVTWGMLIFWVKKDGFMPLREEFYDERGKLIKTLEYTNPKKMSDRVIPTTWTMRSLVKENNSTVIEVIDVTYNKPVKEEVFSLANLKR
ncbi:MAG: outer membrane lipoprotein-sorting protein [Candidatus Omnitrophica bacterium]|nr:outer membrane lipoprotein-sorting protein [Candidatus Omnitrophota bacterium]